MSLRATKLSYVNFRGMLAYSIELKNGKCLLLHAGNGKGKSSLVDGIEFVHSGKVMDLTEAHLRHIQPQGDEAYVTIRLSDSSQIRRNINDGILLPSSQDAEAYIKSHPSPESFILRRPRLQQFMTAKPGERYSQLSGLMGLEWVDETRSAFDEAKKRITQEKGAIQTALDKLFASFDPMADTRQPKTLDDLLTLCREHLKAAGLKELTNLDDSLSNALKDVENRLDPASKKRLIQVSSSLNALEILPPWGMKEEIVNLNATRQAVRNLRKKLRHAEQFELIVAARKCFDTQPQLEACPVCNRNFDEHCNHESVLKSLIARSEQFSALREASNRNTHDTSRMKSSLIALRDWYFRDIYALPEKIISEAEHATLDHQERELNKLIASLYSKDETPATSTIEDTPIFTELETFAADLIQRLEKEKKRLESASPDSIAKAHSTLSKAVGKIPDIRKSLAEKDRLILQEARSKHALSAFDKAKKKALESVCETIADEVKRLYVAIHQDGDTSEVSECTDVLMIPQGGGKGTLKFLIDFFGLVKGCDPRQTLSEGHLDTLGLCIYLASVKCFNPPESQLILDDVLTSVDSEHRSRITDLILREFADYQVILTTHDDVWYEQIAAKLIGPLKDQWGKKKIRHWSLESGPSEAPQNGAKAALMNALDTKTLQDAGGPIRILTEELCQRAARAISLKMPYAGTAPEYTVKTFIDCGLGDKLGELIPKKMDRDYKAITKGMNPVPADLQDHHSKQLEQHEKDISTVFTATFLNMLVHNKPNLHAVPETELEDYTVALLRLRELCNGRFLRDLR